MSATLTPAPSSSRSRLFKRLTSFGRLSAATTTAIGVWILLTIPLYRLAEPSVISKSLGFGLVAVLLGGIIATGWRWTPILGALLGGSLILQDASIWAYTLAHDEVFIHVAWQMLFFPTAILSTIFGVVALVQNYRGVPRQTPRWLDSSIAYLTVLCIGAILAAGIIRGAADTNAAGVSPGVLASLPAVTAQNIKFSPTALTARVGETVALQLVNRDSTPHTFTIDALQVNVAMPPGKTVLALFRPTSSGVYTFYCDVPGHRDSGMSGTLTVTS